MALQGSPFPVLWGCPSFRQVREPRRWRRRRRSSSFSLGVGPCLCHPWLDGRHLEPGMQLCSGGRPESVISDLCSLFTTAFWASSARAYRQLLVVIRGSVSLPDASLLGRGTAAHFSRRRFGTILPQSWAAVHVFHCCLLETDAVKVRGAASKTARSACRPVARNSPRCLLSDTHCIWVSSVNGRLRSVPFCWQL